MKNKRVYSIITIIFLLSQSLLRINVYSMPTNIKTKFQCSNLKVKTITNNFPIVISVRQLDANRLEVTYDRRTDDVTAMRANNYWIQSVNEEIPFNLATLGKNDKISPSNSLKESDVTITLADASNKIYILTFTQEIPIGENYRLIVCNVKSPGVVGFSGINGMIEFSGKDIS